MSTQPFPNGNMLRTTAEFLITSAVPPHKDFLISDYKLGIKDCQTVPGNYSRYPDKLENTSVDDLLVVGSFNQLSALYMLNVARSNWGCISVDTKWSFFKILFNPKKFWSQFFARFQGGWQNLRIIAGENVGLLGQAIWALSLYLAAKEPIGKQDNWVLSHLIVLTYERSGFKSFICEAAIKFWRGKKTKTTSQIMSEYLGPECQDHPLIETWRPYD